MNQQSVGSLKREFSEPPNEYGPVPLWWWDGEPLDPERMTDQLESLAAGGVPSVCFISKYPHGPSGDDQRYFSDEWWDRLEHVARECDRLDMQLWVHDETYHHSPPTWREYWQDNIRAEATKRPELQGEVLHREYVNVEHGEEATVNLPAEVTPLTIAAYPRASDGSLRVEDGIDIDADGSSIEWTPPDDNAWHVTAIGRRPEGLCYTNRHAAERYIDLHFQEYVRRLGDLADEVLAGTFEDELVILDGHVPCDATVLDRFREEYGYDPIPLLVGLYEPLSGATDLRTDYYDVVTTLLEECWFQPLYEWHEAHGLQRSHDNWGRNNIAAGAEQYGDYYRTMRWYQVPGYDDGGPAAIGNRNFFDAKLAASIAACYDRDRVWGELFHSTGWGFRPDDQLAGIVENYCYGCNLYDKHGLYYTTLGGWWEHAPGDVHFRQPYWDQLDAVNDAATRLSYVFSQGDPVVDVALAFPGASLHADWHPDEGIGERGSRIDQATREIANSLYDTGIDLVIADPDSLAEATVTDDQLAISELDIPALVLPPTTHLEDGTLAAVRALHEAGGVVIAAGRLPDHAVGTDEDLPDALAAMFGEGGVPGMEIDEISVAEAEGAGTGVLVPDHADLSAVLDGLIDRDVRTEPDMYHAHRRIGDRDAYLLFNVRDEARTVDVRLRATGRPEVWDPLTGEIDPVYEYETDDGGTTLALDFAPHGFHLVMIGPDDGPQVIDSSLASIDAVEATDDGVSVRGTTRREIAATRIKHDASTFGGEATVDVPAAVELSEGWTFDVEPVLDNEWGDFRYPPSEGRIGPEIHSLWYRAEGPNEDGRHQGWFRPTGHEDGWSETDVTDGPWFWRCTNAGSEPVTPDVSTDEWDPYAFSTDIGKPGTHPYLVGYTSVVSDEVLVSPEPEDDDGGPTYFWTTVRAPEPGAAAIQYGPGIRRIELGARSIEVGHGAGVGGVVSESETLRGGRTVVHLPRGTTAVQLTVEPGVETHFSVEPVESDARTRDLSYVPRVRWFQATPYTFDYKPWEDRSVGWYRFELPTGTATMSVPVQGEPEVWVDGEECDITDGQVELDTPLANPAEAVVRVAHEPGVYAGAAWTEPIAIETEPATVDVGRWEDLGFASYSGRGCYRKIVSLPEFASNDRVILDLGSVGVTATVRVNGEPVGTVVTRPFSIDISDEAVPGENEIEVVVANTLANHFAAETPRRYIRSGPLGGSAEDKLPNARRDETHSGLIGPVTLQIEPAVDLDLD